MELTFTIKLRKAMGSYTCRWLLFGSSLLTLNQIGLAKVITLHLVEVWSSCFFPSCFHKMLQACVPWGPASPLGLKCFSPFKLITPQKWLMPPSADLITSSPPSHSRLPPHCSSRSALACAANPNSSWATYSWSPLHDNMQIFSFPLCAIHIFSFPDPCGLFAMQRVHAELLSLVLSSLITAG